MAKKKTEEVEVSFLADDKTVILPVKSEKEKLLELYQQLKDLGIHSISDLENLIARS